MPPKNELFGLRHVCLPASLRIGALRRVPNMYLQVMMGSAQQLSWQPGRFNEQRCTPQLRNVSSVFKNVSIINASDHSNTEFREFFRSSPYFGWASPWISRWIYQHLEAVTAISLLCLGSVLLPNSSHVRIQ